MQLRFRAAFVLLLTCVGCATYREDLYRGQRLYEENQYEHALAIWRVLETDTDSLSVNEQTRYAYLRGMTDYRLGFRSDARYWLGVAKAIDQQHPGGLNAEWKQRLEESLEDVSKDVYSAAAAGIEKSQATAQAATQAAGEAAKPKDGKCYTNADCPEQHMCDQNQCVKL